MKNKKMIIKFIIIFILTFFVIEGIEFGIEHFFNIDLHELKWGWLGFMIVYGLKYHIFCCIIPAIWAGYKCRHKSCEHDYCEHK